MRRLLLVVPLLIPICAQAQTTAANPVEPFSYGVRVGTAKNPLIAALSSVVPSAQAGSTQAAAPVELFSYGRRVGTQSNPIYVNLGNALDAYVTQTGLTTVLAGYLTKTTADAEYVPVAYGTNGPLLSGEYHYANGGSFTDPANGFSADAKFGGKGIATAALRVAGSSVYSSLTGSGNAYLCIDASGTLYRSSTACQ
ncbi:hypothetical protein JK185_10365 [Gluconobacter wancherniae]|uniref:hypothetical protein n=1 Tax=Gluconobacter wancherniae TaxID=1307955 RepID=UPI001B8CEA91|nr:hypothetical protein [Gluconobacter wancherniae]MBS1063446.1 hypothetical protein [Gluconobacter wancherniae]